MCKVKVQFRVYRMCRAGKLRMSAVDAKNCSAGYRFLVVCKQDKMG